MGKKYQSLFSAYAKNVKRSIGRKSKSLYWQMSEKHVKLSMGFNSVQKSKKAWLCHFFWCGALEWKGEWKRLVQSSGPRSKCVLEKQIGNCAQWLLHSLMPKWRIACFSEGEKSEYWTLKRTGIECSVPDHSKLFKRI